MRKYYFILLISLFVSSIWGQKDFYKDYHFSKADTLRGMLRPERTDFDVTFYKLNIEIDIEKRFLAGYVDIHFNTLNPMKRMQIDLYKNMKINDISLKGNALNFERIGNATFINFPKEINGSHIIRVKYEGNPTTAKNAPWDGGFVWKKDDNGNPWVGVACEGAGASLWWPNKDHLSDEPDSMAINITIPNNLTCVSNGTLRSRTPLNEAFDTWNWFVHYPINNYNVTVNIADYAHFQEWWVASDGDSLQCDYYVLPDNLEKAKKQFAQVPQMLDCYEKYFSKYPFWKDGYCMVETPYLGMEHQGAIAYGNEYKRGYMGGMIPKDMDWDYIIIHEAGHEWWGNSISCNDHAEMWIHESFTTYMEALYVECRYGYEDAIRYLASQSSNIKNVAPMVGPLDVNFEDFGSSDHYYKGAWMLHTLRHAMMNDELFFDILKSFYLEHAQGHIVTSDFTNYVNKRTGKNWDKFFEQYLYFAQTPIFEYKIKKKKKGTVLEYRWNSKVEGFDMPIQVGTKENYQLIHPTSEWQTIRFKKISVDDFRVARELFLVRLGNYSS